DKLSKKQKAEMDDLSKLSEADRKRKLQEIAATAGAAKLLDEDQGLLSALLDTSNADAFQEKFRTLASTGGEEANNAAAGSIDPFGGTLGTGGASGGFVGSTSIGSGRAGSGKGALIDGLDKTKDGRDLDDIKLRERPMTPVAIASSAKVSGRLDRKTVQKIIRRNLSGIKWCYQDALQRNPKLRGKVTLSFTILPNGRLQTPKAHNPSIKDNKLLDCITGKMKRWKFPAPKDGGVVKVTYPLILKTR
ncbi:MAG: AgmX/PglI C-terminal domain-containing protein, partial [Myxococcota bacterium]|nr:AgmX/PglI C-terminal domain-containing protein [Myxococcota bacterium]